MTLARAPLSVSVSEVAGVASLALVTEVGLVRLTFMQGTSPFAFLAGHTLVVLLVGGWAWRRGRSSTYGWLTGLVTAACGPIGAGGVLVAMVVQHRRRRRAVSIDAWHKALFPPHGVDEQGELWRRVGQRASDRAGEQRVTPFLDVLAFGSVQQRQAVVGIIAQQFKPAFAPALKAALRDEHNVVRVQAATAIARLEQEFLERTIGLEAAVQTSPGDLPAVLALATHYDDQAFGGLLDATREQDCREKATARYQEYLRERPDALGVLKRLARLQLRRGRPAEAEAGLRQLYEAGHTGARLWLMECLFAQGKYAELRAVATRDDPSPVQDTAALDAESTIDLWAGREDAA